MSERDEQLAQFQVRCLVEIQLCNFPPLLQSITGCDADRAQFYLESANWQLDLAMASFYEGDGEEAGMDVGGGGGGAADPAPAPAQSAGGAAGRINIVSGGQDDDEDDSDSEQQAFYAGGSTNSGNMVSSSWQRHNLCHGDLISSLRRSWALRRRR